MEGIDVMPAGLSANLQIYLSHIILSSLALVCAWEQKESTFAVLLQESLYVWIKLFNPGNIQTVQGRISWIFFSNISASRLTCHSKVIP
jgi:hypothetical protein